MGKLLPSPPLKKTFENTSQNPNLSPAKAKPQNQ